jgi:CheY-like chemotaxis protein
MTMRRPSGYNGREPRIGGHHPARITGQEPSLGHGSYPLYGPIRMVGLEAPPVIGRRRPLVILAEYDDDTAELALLLADSNGYDVRRVDDGREAWHLVRALEPNLLVTNLRLPGMSGQTLMRRIREYRDPLLANVPILVMDVHHGHQDVLAAFLAGADDYLEKPYDDVRAMLRCWRRATGSFRRPAPLTAMLNEDVMIRQVALACLLEMRPAGLVGGLADLLWHADPDVCAAVRWGLQRLNTPEALDVLSTHIGDLPVT